MSKVTVVPRDRLVIVDGEGLQFDFDTDANIHALQWDDSSGHIEYVDGSMNRQLGASDYDAVVKPYVDAHAAEKTRAETEKAEERRRLEEEYNSTQARAGRVRSERNRRISACDYTMCMDVYASMTAEQQTAWATYRQALRDITSLDSFPWDGGGEETPWPAQPE